MKVLVTGGAGFIGSHIVDKLVQKKYKVSVVDNLSTGRKENINKAAVFYKCDITDLNNLDSVFRNEEPDFVIHQAAQISAGGSLKSPSFDAIVNITGTINILECCVKYKVKKIIFASSAAVYGEPQYLPIDEQHELKPISPYGLSKLTAENYIMLYKKLYGLEYTILRYANVYGPRQDAEGEGGVVAIFINRLLKGITVEIYGDGRQTRDFIYVEDVANANIATLRADYGGIFNISTNSQTSVRNLLNTLCVINGSITKPIYRRERIGDIRKSSLDNTKTIQTLNWQCTYSFYEGLENTLRYYKAYQNKELKVEFM